MLYNWYQLVLGVVIVWPTGYRSYFKKFLLLLLPSSFHFSAIFFVHGGNCIDNINDVPLHKGGWCHFRDHWNWHVGYIFPTHQYRMRMDMMLVTDQEEDTEKEELKYCFMILNEHDYQSVSHLLFSVCNFPKNEYKSLHWMRQLWSTHKQLSQKPLYVYVNIYT